MYSVVALFLLIVAFVILVVTFLWVARLLGLLGTKPQDVESVEVGEDETPPTTDNQGPVETGQRRRTKRAEARPSSSGPTMASSSAFWPASCSRYPG